MTTPTRPDLVLLDFDAWANERLFDACDALDAAVAGRHSSCPAPRKAPRLVRGRPT